MGLSCAVNAQTYNPMMQHYPPHTPKPRTDTRAGFTKAAYLTDDQIDQILEAIAEGEPVNKACRDAGTSGTQFKHRRHNDPELTERYERALESQQPAQQEALRAEWWHQIFVEHNWKALHAAIITRLPEGASLRTSRLEVGNVPGEKLLVQHEAAFAEAFKNLPTQELERRVRLLEQSDEHPVLELGPGNSA